MRAECFQIAIRPWPLWHLWRYWPYTIISYYFVSSRFFPCFLHLHLHVEHYLSLFWGTRMHGSYENFRGNYEARTVAVVTIDMYSLQLAFLRIRPNTPEHNHRVWIVSQEAKFSCQLREITCRSLPLFARIEAFCMVSFNVLFIVRICKCVPSGIR
jgi:hypothetical protein